MTVYYDCPLQAAYMARYFGINYNFTNHHGKQIEAHIKHAKAKHSTFVSNQILKNKGAIKYIHPDSLPIFRLKVGDVVAAKKMGLVRW
jgi:hypothetical protein